MGSNSSDDNEDFYTPGDESLIEHRVAIAKTSLLKAKLRLDKEYQEYLDYDEVATIKQRRSLYSHVKKNLQLDASQVISPRFTSDIHHIEPAHSLSEEAKSQFLIGSWDGKCYVMDQAKEAGDEMELLKSFDHGDKVSTVDYSSQSGNVFVGGFSSDISIFDTKTDSKNTLSGHLNRITKVKHHMDHPYLFSSSHDETWRFWDLVKMKEVYYQEGHTGALNDLDLHTDGSLIASAGRDGFIKLWDLRSGQLIADLVNEGHVGGVQSVKFRPDGTQLASGGTDHNLIIWDLRNTSSKMESLLVHKGVITSIDFTKDNMCMVSGSYDGKVVISECDSWNPIKKFESVDKVMSVITFEGSISEKQKYNFNLASVGWAGDVKMYSMEED